MNTQFTHENTKKEGVQLETVGCCFTCIINYYNAV